MEEHGEAPGQKHPVSEGNLGRLDHKSLRARTREGEEPQEAIQDDDDENNEFGCEDPFGDEFEEESEGSDDDDDGQEDPEQGAVDDDVTGPMNGVEISDSNENQQPEQVRAWRPGVDQLEEGEELEYDSKAYEMYHVIHAEWPCLSFDVIHDNLGSGRNLYPMSLVIATGTQSSDSNDKLTLMKLSGMDKCKMTNDDDDDGESDDDDEVDADEPTIQHFNAGHYGCVNRLRCMPQDNGIIATWSEQGLVHVYNLSRVSALLTSTSTSTSVNLNKNRLESSSSPILTFRGHSTEGYALDWSRLDSGKIATGDNNGSIKIFNIQSPSRFDNHRSTNAVQDLSWSCTESTVFISACNNGLLSVHDTRATSKPMLSSVISSSDINVVSWNRTVSYLVATGDDDGRGCIYDLRSWSSSTIEPTLALSYHKKAITSIEWDPNDEASLVCSSDDDSITIWDVSVEYNDGDDGDGDVPQQLLFVHQGQEQIKEVHYHDQIPGLVVSTSLDGFNVFKPRFAVHDDK